MTQQYVARREVREVTQGTAEVHQEDGWEEWDEPSDLCYACAAERHGGDYLHAIGLVDWTDDPAGEPDPAPHWTEAEQEAWLARRAERRRESDRRLLDAVLDHDMFEDAPRADDRTPPQPPRG